ncbi:MAG: hypothetical protein AMJ73_04955 [candidate division Zixibacteria bacterium SM1_73]|nr:MAG: hypothetical protein AMJ73_04955 [candidate division Zixibacteria bacterium SM1_73]
MWFFQQTLKVAAAFFACLVAGGDISLRVSKSLSKIISFFSEVSEKPLQRGRLECPYGPSQTCLSFPAQRDLEDKKSQVKLKLNTPEKHLPI